MNISEESARESWMVVEDEVVLLLMEGTDANGICVQMSVPVPNPDVGEEYIDTVIQKAAESFVEACDMSGLAGEIEVSNTFITAPLAEVLTWAMGEQAMQFEL